MRGVCLLFVISFLSFVSSNLIIRAPPELVDQIRYDRVQGSMKYSVSTFGDILYNQSEEVVILMPQKGNENGCKEISFPNEISKEYSFVLLLKRGGCTYTKKAYNAQQIGAYAVLVYFNLPGQNVENIIPVDDHGSYRKINRS